MRFSVVILSIIINKRNYKLTSSSLPPWSYNRDYYYNIPFSIHTLSVRMQTQRVKCNAVVASQFWYKQFCQAMQIQSAFVYNTFVSESLVVRLFVCYYDSKNEMYCQKLRSFERESKKANNATKKAYETKNICHVSLANKIQTSKRRQLKWISRKRNNDFNNKIS